MTLNSGKKPQGGLTIVLEVSSDEGRAASRFKGWYNEQGRNARLALTDTIRANELSGYLCQGVLGLLAAVRCHFNSADG